MKDKRIHSLLSDFPHATVVLVCVIPYLLEDWLCAEARTLQVKPSLFGPPFPIFTSDLRRNCVECVFKGTQVIDEGKLDFVIIAAGSK